ncbi:hypothetical protein niasHS_008481 [Heterodera schachtii]|uniref:Uncharacterized protein n=1 Tax=Heterodera schachtii TaxID=97005 RepID=A0ABD2J478_HETSC
MRKLLILNIFVVWIFGVFADFKCYDVLEDEEFDVPDNNLMVKLYTNGDLLVTKENGGDNELKQFICDLSRWYILFGMELDHHTNNQTHSEGKAVGTTTAHAKKSKKSCCFKFTTKTKTKAEKDDEKKHLKEKIGILKSIDQADQTLGNMLRKMSTLINKIKGSIDEKHSHNTEMQELQQLDMEIVRVVIYLAYRLGIRIEKIIPKNKNKLKIEQIELLNGLANVWLKYRRKNWHYQQKPENEREKCKRKNKQYEKHLLQLVANFSNEGLDELSKLKRDRKNGRRRKRNPSNNTKSKIATVIVIVVMLMALSLCVINHCDNSGRSENSDQNHHRQQQDSDATQTSNEKTDGSGISINEPLLRGKGQKKGGNRRISARKLNKMRQTKAKQFVEQRERVSETENEEEDIVLDWNQHQCHTAHQELLSRRHGKLLKVVLPFFINYHWKKPIEILVTTKNICLILKMFLNWQVKNVDHQVKADVVGMVDATEMDNKAVGETVDVMEMTKKAVETEDALEMTKKAVETEDALEMTKKAVETEDALEMTKKAVETVDVMEMTKKAVETEDALEMTKKAVETEDALEMTKKAVETEDAMEMTKKAVETEDAMEITKKAVEKLRWEKDEQ